MAYRGDIGHGNFPGKTRMTRDDKNLAIIPLGGNIVTNTGLPGAPSQLIVLLGRRGVKMDGQIDDTNGIWTFYDVGPGRYYAQETGLARVWQVDVSASTGAATVTRIFSGGGASIGYAG